MDILCVGIVVSFVFLVIVLPTLILTAWLSWLGYETLMTIRECRLAYHNDEENKS